MAVATRGRGSRDTPDRASRGPSRGARRVLWTCLIVSLFLHAPLVPLNLFKWLGIVLDAKDIAANDVDGEAIIPIDLDLDLHGDSTDPAGQTHPPPSGDQSAGEADAAPPKPKPRPKVDLDAGVDGSADASPPADVDGGVSDAGEIAVAFPDAGPETPKGSLKDPIGAAGDPSKIAGKDPNVQVLLAADRLRSHELGATFGQLLTALPEWAEFFDGTTIDPIKDFDHVLIAGPQFKDFRKVVAVIDYNCSEKKVRDAMSVIADRTKGTWIDDSPVPALRLTLARDHGERILAFVPEKHLLVMLPKEAKDQLSQLKTTKPFAKSSVGILLSMVTPARAFRGLPIAIPDSLKWMRLSVTPRPNGEADLDIEALDGSAAEAAKHAPELTQGIEAIRKIDLGLFVIQVVDHTEFVAKGALLRAHVHVTKKQLRFVMDEVESFFGKKKKPPP